MCHGCEVQLGTDYNGIGKVLYILGQHGVEAYESEYGADVKLKIRIKSEDAERLCKELTEVTSGRICWDKTGEGYFLF